MAEVGVHLEDQVVPVLERPAEAREVGLPQPGLARPVQHVDPRLGGGQLVGQLAGAVGRIVVHDQHVELGILLQDLGHDERQVTRSL